MPDLGVHVPEAKLRPPRVPDDAVERGRLLTAMARPGLSVVLVVGPACAGKTTLAAQWGRGQTRPVAWLTVDYADNDPAVLLRGLGAAIERACGRGGPLLRAVEREPAAPLAAVDALLSHLGGEPPMPLAIVVDDIHLLDDPRALEALARLVEWLPPAVTMLLAGRSVPDHMPLARWLVRRRALLVDADALTLDLDEALAVAAARAGRALPDEFVRGVQERCEGWLGGVCLAVLAAAHADDLDRFLRRFSGTTSVLADFLLEEVFEQHGAEMQADLLDLSVLDRFNVGLLEAVTERPRGRQRLERLARTNQFVTPLDDGRWFRFHPLLGEFLRDRAELGQPDRLPALHRRAAGWFGARHDAVTAVDHLLAAEAWDEAAGVVLRIGDLVRRQNRYRTLHRWFEALPDDVVAAEPGLVALALSAQIAVPRPTDASWLRPAARRSGPPASMADALVEIQTTGRVLDMPRRLEVVRWAEAQPESSDPAARCRLATFHGAAAFACGEHAEATRAMSTVVHARDEDRSPGQLLTALAWLTALAFEGGDVEAMRRHVATCRTLEIEGPGLAPFAALAEGLLAEATGEPEAALAHFAAASDELHTAGVRHVRVVALCHQARLLVGLGRPNEGAAALRALRRERDAAVDLGAHLAAIVADTEARAGGVAVGPAGGLAAAPPPTAGESSPADGDLSPRERQVLRLLRSHLTLREIADQLYVSHNTIKTHVAAVYRKLGVSGRAELQR